MSITDNACAVGGSPMLLRDVNAVECQDGAASAEEPKTPVLRAHQHCIARAYRKGSYCVSDIVAPPRCPESKASG
jgi:hypothetical protein